MGNYSCSYLSNYTAYIDKVTGTVIDSYIF